MISTSTSSLKSECHDRAGHVDIWTFGTIERLNGTVLSINVVQVEHTPTQILIGEESMAKRPHDF
jgi:hypothetical protein